MTHHVKEPVHLSRYTLYPEASNDVFARKTFNEMDYRRPLLSYLEKSILLLGNCSKNKETKRQNGESTLRRPLTKQKQLVLRDILNVEKTNEHEKEERTTSKSDESSLLYPQTTPSTLSYDDVVANEKKGNLQEKADVNPIIIPTVPALSSDEESDCESVSDLELRGQDITVEDSETEEIHDGKLMDSCSPTIKPTRHEFNLPFFPSKKTGSSKSKYQGSRFNDIISSPVIRGKISSTIRPLPDDKVKNVTTIVNLDDCWVSPSVCTNVCNDRMRNTCNYFHRLEAKQNHLIAERSRREYTRHSIRCLRGSFCSQESCSINREKQNLEIHNENGQNIETSKKSRKDSKDKLFLHYINGNEVCSKTFIPKSCDITSNCRFPDEPKKPIVIPVSGNKKSTINAGHARRKKTARLSNSAAMQKTNNLKSKSIYTCERKVSSAKESGPNASHMVQRKGKTKGNLDTMESESKNITPVKILTLSRKAVPKRTKNSAQSKKPVVTMVSLSTSDVPSDNRIKMNSNSSNVSVMSTPEGSNQSTRNAFLAKMVCPTKPKPVHLTFPINVKATSPKDSCSKPRTPFNDVKSPIQDAKFNEYKEIQNLLKAENVKVSMNMIRDALM